MKVKTFIDIEIYPDGTITVFDEGGGVVGKLPASKVLRSIESNLTACDWLTEKHLKSFISKLEKLTKGTHDE